MIPSLPRRPHPLIVALVLAATGPAAGAANQPGSTRGTYIIHRSDDTLGFERWRIDRTPTGVELTTVATYPAHRPRVEWHGTLTLSADSQPVVARAEKVRGGTALNVVQFGGRRMTVRRKIGQRESAREFPRPRRPLLLPDSLFAFHALLPGGNGPLTLINPATDRQTRATLVDRGSEPTRIGGRAVVLRHLVLSAGSLERHLWFDAAGTLQRLDLPALGIVVERTATPPRPE